MRYGDRIRAGGDLATTLEDFLTWPAGYDVPGFPGCSRTLHEAWMTRFSGLVVRVDTARPVDELVAQLAAP